MVAEDQRRAQSDVANGDKTRAEANASILAQILEALTTPRQSVGTMEDFRQLAPPTFTGEEGPLSAASWLRKTEVLLRAARIPDDEMVTTARFQLQGVAEDWWDDTEGQYPGGVTWSQFGERFLARFFPPWVRKQMERQFIFLEQGTMTVRQYSTEFSRLSRFAPRLVQTDEDRRSRFVEGLSRGLQRSLKAHSGATYARTVELAEEYEALDVPIAPIPETSGGQKRPLDFSTPEAGPSMAKRPQFQTRPTQWQSTTRTAPQQPYQQRTVPTCYHCGKLGHRRQECRRLLGLCLTCGGAGHFASQCPHGRQRAPTQPLPREASSALVPYQGPPTRVQQQQGRPPLVPQAQQFHAARVQYSGRRRRARGRQGNAFRLEVEEITDPTRTLTGIASNKPFQL